MQMAIAFIGGENGTACAVGCLIPDNLYDPDIEGHTMCSVYKPDGTAYAWNSKEQTKLIKILEVLGLIKYRELLASLQSAHDEDLMLSVEDFENEMSVIAKKHNLVYTAPTN